MDARTLHKLTNTVSLQRCQELLPGLLQAWHLAEVNTVKRRAMWLAQVLEETGGLQWTQELADGSEYNWRSDLGNTQAGDGPRFKGRGFIQLTGRHNYGAFSQWCHKRGLVSDDNYFVNHPEQVANDRFAWISVAFFWMGNHGHQHGYLNAAADAGDLVDATYMINGGQNGIDIRRYFYSQALALGDELMGGVSPDDPNWSDMATKAEIAKMIDARVAAALFGGNDNLHKQRPILYADKNHGVFDRLRVIVTRLNAHASTIRAQGGKLDDVTDDLKDISLDVAALQKEMSSES